MSYSQPFRLSLRLSTTDAGGFSRLSGSTYFFGLRIRVGISKGYDLRDLEDMRLPLSSDACLFWMHFLYFNHLSSLVGALWSKPK